MTYNLTILRATPGQITTRAQIDGLTRAQLTAEVAYNLRSVGPITAVEVRKGTGAHDLLYAGSAEGLKGRRL